MRKAIITRNLSGRALMELFLDQIQDEEVKALLKAGKLTVSDFEIYSVRKADGSRTEMFKPSDAENENFTNINNAKLRDGGYFVAQSIQLLGGVNADTLNDPEGKLIDFGKVASSVANGNISFYNGSQEIFSNSSVTAYRHDGTAELLPGEKRLESPKLLHPKKEIRLDLDNQAGHAADYFVRAVIRGVILTKA
jgi:hypothetical protein